MFRVYIAGLFHETHTFVDEATSLNDFEIRTGNQIFQAEGDSSPLGGALEYFRDQKWEIVPGADYRATPGGTVHHAVFDSFWNDVESSWDESVDAVFLVLHGAMVSESCRDVEGEFLRRLRKLPGAAMLPVFGVFDLHANFSPAMAEHSDLLLAYRENPHFDARDASVRAARELCIFFALGRKPFHFLHRHSGLVWAPVHTATADDPMHTLESEARKIEAGDSDVIGVNVCAGFAYADTETTGVSFQIATRDPESGKRHLERLVDLAQSFSVSSFPTDRDPDSVMNEIRENPCAGLTVLTEPSDNIGAGAPGDMTGALRALLKHRITNAAICLHDPLSVEEVRALRPGQSTTLKLGGKESRFDSGPVALEVEFLSRSEGAFKLEDPRSHLASLYGDRFDMGPSAVVRTHGITILLTSRRTPPFDLGQWRSQGIEPENLDVIVVKAAVAHRKCYDPVTVRSFALDTPGPCRSDLTEFPFAYVSGVGLSGVDGNQKM